MDHPFRNAAFGGFHRQDVLDYLEKTSQETLAQRQQLEQQLHQAQQNEHEQEQANQQSRAKLEQLQSEHEHMAAQFEQTQQALTQAQQQALQQAQQLEQLKQECDALHHQLSQLRPDAEAYAAIKDRAAGVELDAHHRAQQVTEQAQLQVREIRAQAAQWIAQVGREYDALRYDIQTTVAHSLEQIKKAHNSLEAVADLMDRNEIELQSISTETHTQQDT